MKKHYDEFDVALGTLLKERRKELGVMQKDVAKHFGIAKQTLCCYESGYQSINFSLVCELCEYYFLNAGDTMKKAWEMARNEK